MTRYLLGIIGGRFSRLAIAVGLAISILALGATNSWAGRESVGFANFTLFKFVEGQVEDWTQKVMGNGTVEYECKDPDANMPNDSCQAVVDAIGICTTGNKNVIYTCDEDAVLILLPSGVLLVPDDCDGTCG